MAPNDHADVIVVGAGVLGTSTALHLLERGVRRVVLLDANECASGTSGAGGGFVGAWAAGYASFFRDAELELQSYGIDYYERLAADSPDVECRVNGNMYLATTDDGLDNWVTPVVDHELAPAGTRSLDPAEVCALTGGVVAADSVVGGALHPAGIQISAGRATRALARRVVQRGGELRTNTRVSALLTGGDRVSGVRTEAGDLHADHVVLACGAWTNDLLSGVAGKLPMLRMVATRVISPPSGVPTSMPTVMVPDLFGLWVREHRGGLTWGNGDGYAPLYQIGGTAGRGGQPRREELVARLDQTLSPNLRKLIPTHDISIGWWLQGVPCMTPDRLFYAGSVAGVERLHVVCGDNEAGVTHGPGLGRLLADLVVDGASDWVDAARYRTDRFDADQFPDEAAVAAAMPVRR